MKIGDRCFVHGYIDEIRKDTVIIRNNGGYFGTIPSEVITGELSSAQPEVIRCKDCKHSEHWYRGKRRCFLWHEEGIDVFEYGYCNYGKRRTRGEQE